MDNIKKGHKNGDYTDDDLHNLEDQVQKVTDKAIKGVDAIAAEKEQEVLTD